MVTPDNLRFDFSHFQKVSDEELREVEHFVNKKIRENIPLTEYRDYPIEKAKELGAIALFGEKYGDRVRVVQFGDSVEFCGGCHTSSTGNIGMFRILSESSVAAGVRRIEAVTGERLEEVIDGMQNTLREISALFNNVPDLKIAIHRAIEENSELKKKVEEAAKETTARLKDALAKSAIEINGVKVISGVYKASSSVMKDIAFQLRGEIKDNLLFICGSSDGNKPTLTVMISDNLVKDHGLNASKMIREAAKLIQGGGGGQPHFATAGGKNVDGLGEAVNKLIEFANI